jgi:hypothetical protein
MPERIAALVYVDAFVPDDGQSWWDLAGDHFRKLAIDGSAADGFGVAPPPSAGGIPGASPIRWRRSARPFASPVDGRRLRRRCSSTRPDGTRRRSHRPTNASPKIHPGP